MEDNFYILTEIIAEKTAKMQEKMILLIEMDKLLIHRSVHQDKNNNLEPKQKKI